MIRQVLGQAAFDLGGMTADCCYNVEVGVLFVMAYEEEHKQENTIIFASPLVSHWSGCFGPLRNSGTPRNQVLAHTLSGYHSTVEK